MSNPRRYLDDERAAPLARALLQSAADDGLDETRVAELARALSAGAGGAAAGEPFVADARSRLPYALFAASKWALLAILPLAVAGGVFIARDDGRAPTSNAVPSDGTAAPPIAEPAVVSTTSERPPPDAVPVALLPEAPPESVARVTRKSGAGGAATPASSASGDLAAEVRALERVRGAIAERRLSDARAGLESYERAFPKKLLGSEARVLEIELLLADGRREEAEARARAFLASSADSPYGARVRSLIARPRLP